jgi:hypothetical protein
MRIASKPSFSVTFAFSLTPSIPTTYPEPAHPTSIVDTPLVVTAVTANATRAPKGSEDSMRNMKGVREVERTREEREKSLRVRYVRVSGPV